MLRVLIDPSMETAAAEIIFSETTTLGIRVQDVKRIEIPREEKTVSTVFGPCKVKLAHLPNGSERLIPEYEECRRIAEETGTPLPDVYSRIVTELKMTPGFPAFFPAMLRLKPERSNTAASLGRRVLRRGSGAEYVR